MDSVVEILLGTGSGSEALRRLLILARQRSPKWSHAFVASKIGCSSRSHVSDLLCGRRTLTNKYWEPIIKLLNLKGLELKLARALLEAEAEIMERGELRTELSEKIDSLRSAIQSQQFRYSYELVSSIFTMQVHAAFGMFGNKVEKRQLIQFFGREHVLDIERSLQILLREGIVQRQEGIFELLPERNFIAVIAGNDSREHVIAYLQHCLELSRVALPKWAARKDVACFRSAHISVSREEFPARLDELRTEIERQQNQLSSQKADMMVRVDFQIYPIGGNTDEES